MVRPNRPAFAAAFAAALGGGSSAAEDSYPRLEGGVTVEIENDFTFDSTDPAADGTDDLFTTTEAGLALLFSERSSLNATILLEPIRDPAPFEDREFEDHGLYAEELYLRHDFGAFAIAAGKFDPGFGFAWDLAPGVFGVDFAEDYELTERLGAAVEIPLGLGGGEAVFTLAAFAADRTFLSDSLIANRGDLDEADGGVSNTDAPESFVASLAGEAGGVSWTVAARRQAEGDGDADDEWGFVGGLVAPIGGDLGIEAIAEAAVFPEFDGGPESALYLTLGLSAPVGPVTLSAVYALREVESAPTDHLATVSAEYEIAEGATVAAAWRYGREASEDNHTFGLLFVYEFGF